VAGSARSLKARARRRRRRAVAATPVVDVPHAEDQMAESQELLKLITQEIDTNKFEDEHWEGSFSQYEKDRVGIGTFQPKDEKNQDSTELTGDINYRKIAEYGRTRTRARSTSTASSTSPTAA
jgi:hypothetical protein